MVYEYCVHGLCVLCGFGTVLCVSMNSICGMCLFPTCDVHVVHVLCVVCIQGV